MSSTESSGASAENTATTPAAPAAEFPSFGTTRGSGLARGKRPSTAAATPATTAPSDYKPTAIEVVSAPREYTNPFAPAEEPAAAAAPAPAPASPEPAERAAENAAPATAPSVEAAPSPAPAAEEPAQLNILPPAEQKTAPAQTWESAGFAPIRERAPREEPPEEVDIASIPPQFLYVRPGVKFVPTPRNWGGAPRERRHREDDAPPRSGESPRATEAAAPATPAKSGGLFGWIKSLFGGPSASKPVTAGGESSEQRRDGGHRRHRGGRGGRGGEGGGHRRHRGGRGRNRSYGGESEGTRSSGSL